MSKNVHTVFIDNPATSMQPNDLYYLGRSPYGLTDDMAILWSNVLASIQAQIPGGYTWSTTSGAATINMAVNHGYVTGDDVNLATFALPTTPVLGDSVKITGLGLAGWLIQLTGTQKIHMGNGNITLGTGTLASTHQHDSITLRAASTNVWIVEAAIGNLTTT